MNTSHLENVAESLVVHELLRNGIFVAKPFGDVLGADLLAFSEFKDGVRFCRIQCKGRSVEGAKSFIEIPAQYVDAPFVVLLYVALGFGNGQLFCFFSSDVRQWRRSASGKYILRVTKSQVESTLQFYRFTDAKMVLLKALIDKASTSGAFHEAVYGECHGVMRLPGSSEA